MVGKILLLFVFLSIGFLMLHTISATAERDCSSNQICALPGDYLKYAANVYGHNGTITYNFGNFIDPTTLNVTISTVTAGQTINAKSILSLKNTTLINNDGSKGPFFFMVLTPINPGEIAASPFKEATGTYENYQRSVYAIDSSNGTDSQEVVIDKETGVLLAFKVQHVQLASGQPVATGTSFVLVDTNIITTSDLQNTNGNLSPTTTANNSTNIPNSISNIPNSISNSPSSVSSVSISNPSNDPTKIYIGIGIVMAAAAGIIITRKRKSKTT